MTDAHPTATDYRNRSERAEQEATEAWACADRMAEALDKWLHYDGNDYAGGIQMMLDYDNALTATRQALAAYREKRG